LVLCVEAGNSPRGDLCRGRMVVPRERGMLSHGRDAPIGDR
jgi:hypothetical protein